MKKKKELFLIQCERIILREYIPEDLDSIYKITLQTEIQKYLPDWVASREQREEWLMKYEIPENQSFLSAAPNIEDNILRLVIIEKASNEVIGWIVSGLKTELPEPNREIAYGMHNQYTNNGYATEAAEGMIQYLFNNTDTKILSAVARIDNPSSNRVIQKVGFDYIGQVDIDQHKYSYYRLFKNKNE